jgi:cytochrome c-type biogenesis protein CcmE
MKPKNQRLVLVAAAIVAVLAAALLAMWGLREKASYFYTPAEIAAGKAPVGKAIRLGGMVEKGSLTHADPLTIRFAVTDGESKVVVSYRGITPDLFREGSGVVAEGRLLRSGSFSADNILAKHDDRYMPPEVGKQAA